MIKPENKELFEAELEIEELAMQLADMLGVALHYAGVKKDMIREAVDAYLKSMDELFEDSEHVEYGYEEVIRVIEHMRENNRHLFN